MKLSLLTALVFMFSTHAMAEQQSASVNPQSDIKELELTDPLQDIIKEALDLFGTKNLSKETLSSMIKLAQIFKTIDVKINRPDFSKSNHPGVSYDVWIENLEDRNLADIIRIADESAKVVKLSKELSRLMKISGKLKANGKLSDETIQTIETEKAKMNAVLGEFSVVEGRSALASALMSTAQQLNEIHGAIVLALGNNRKTK